MRPAAFLFDMDGLLLDSERIAQASFVEVSTAHGLDAEQAAAHFLTMVGTSQAVSDAMVVDHVRDHVAPEVFSKDWSAAFQDRAAHGIPLKPHVGDVLQRLDQSGARMAVVTSTSGGHARQNLERAGILHHFERVTGGDEVSRNKPHPAPYLETAEALRVDPASCAAFEDSDRGIAAAVAAGCRAVQVPDLRPPHVPLPALGQIIADTLEQAVRAVAPR